MLSAGTPTMLRVSAARRRLLSNVSGSASVAPAWRSLPLASRSLALEQNYLFSEAGYKLLPLTITARTFQLALNSLRRALRKEVSRERLCPHERFQPMVFAWL
jgi:hypothetical protein